MMLGLQPVRAAIAVVTLGALLASTATPAVAAARCPRTTELAMESKIMCQVCGVPLALANSLEADRERLLITTLVNRCDTVGQIEAAMVAQYGPGVLASPGSHGFAIAAWLVPAVGVLGAALAIGAVILVARRRRRGTEIGRRGAPVSPAEDARLDAALTAFNARQ